MLFDGQQPFVLDAAGDCPHSLSVRLPYEEVGPAARLLLRYCVVSMLATSPLLAPLLAGLLRSCVGRAQIDHQAGAGIAEAVLSLLRALPEEDAPCLASHRGDMGRLHQCIVERHADRGLTPSEIAAALELPLRRLHALCAAQGSSCMERLYSFRLDRARSLLLQRSRDRRSIGDVAASCGFVSAAHFSRRFAQRFGYPPIALRSRG
jgi:AraC-like DNA-binding protein